MAAAVIQVWDGFESYGGTCVGVLQPYAVAAGTEAEGVASTLRVVVPRDVARESTVGEGHLLRIVSRSRGTEWWWITQVQDGDGDVGMVTITAGTLRQLLAVRGLVRTIGAGSPTYSFSPGSKTPAQLINDYVLTNQAADGVSWLQLGSIAFTDPIEIGAFDRVNRGTILDRIEQQTGFTIELQEQYTLGLFAGVNINLIAPTTSGTASVLLSSGAQIDNLQRTRNTLQAATVAVPFSASGEPIRECVWRVTAISGTGPYRLTLADLTSGLPAPIREDDQLNGLRVVQRDGTATAIADSFASDSSVEIASLGTLAVNDEVAILTSALIPPQEVTSPSGLASSRGRLVATVQTQVTNVVSRELVINGAFTAWTSSSQATNWADFQAGGATIPQHARYARNTQGSWTAKVDQALQWDTAAPFIYKTIAFNNATPNSWIFEGEIVSIYYSSGGSAVSKIARVQTTTQASSGGSGTLTIESALVSLDDGFNTNFIAGSIYSASSSGTVPAGTFDIILLTPRPTFSGSGDVARSGFRFLGGAAAANSRLHDAKVKVFYNVATPYLHYSVGCTESGLETNYGLYGDTALVRAAVGIVEDTGGNGTLLSSASATGTAPTVSAATVLQGPGNPWHITQLTGTQANSTIAGVYTMTADKTVFFSLYPARCRKATIVGDNVLSGEASAATYWYNASMSLSATNTPPTSVPSRSGSNLLWHRAQDVLQGAGVSARYTLRGIDLDALLSQVETIGLGQLVRVRSERLGVDATVRVIRLDFSFTDVETLNLELGAVAPRLTGVTVSL